MPFLNGVEEQEWRSRSGGALRGAEPGGDFHASDASAAAATPGSVAASGAASVRTTRPSRRSSLVEGDRGVPRRDSVPSPRPGSVFVCLYNTHCSPACMGVVQFLWCSGPEIGCSGGMIGC